MSNRLCSTCREELEDLLVYQIVSEYIRDRQWLLCNRCGNIGDSKDNETCSFTARVDIETRNIAMICDICEPIVCQH